MSTFIFFHCSKYNSFSKSWEILITTWKRYLLGGDFFSLLDWLIVLYWFFEEIEDAYRSLGNILRVYGIITLQSILANLLFV